MRGAISILAILLCACGNGGGQDDTAIDQPGDPLDTQGDTTPDTTTDDVEAEVECTSDGDCDDECDCTRDSCNTETWECEYGVLCEMCRTDLDCYDGDPCTIDSCLPAVCGEFEGANFCSILLDPECGSEECPEPGEFVFSMDWEPHPGLAWLTSTGTVLGVQEDPIGTLAITVDLTAGEHAPGSHAFSVPLPAGVGIDLHEDDEVMVVTRDLTSCIGCPMRELIIEREGVLVLYALDCANEVCNEIAFDAGPLMFQVLSGACAPWEDGMPGSPWCFIKENSGLEVWCPGDSGTVQSARLFVGELASLECTVGVYHVAAGTQTRVIDYSGSCFDYIGEVRQLLVIRG